VLIRRAKNDPTGEGRVAWLAPLTLKLVRGWLAQSGTTSGRIFRRIHGMARLGEPLRPRAVAEILLRMARGAGLPPQACLQTTAHSARVGAAQDLAADNTELPAIMLAGGWRDPRQVIRYTEKAAANRAPWLAWHDRKVVRKPARPDAPPAAAHVPRYTHE
jgi:integrase/recombinase XerD